MSPVEAIMKRVRTEFRGPAVVRVEKGFIRSGQKSGYCFDGTVLRPGSLEETEELLKEIEVSPIWAGKSGQGIYCPPEEGQTVIVSFLDFNPGFPFYQGVYGRDYSPAGGTPGSFSILDGKGGEFKMSGNGLFSLCNSTTGLKAILEKLIDEMSKIKVVDPVSGTLPVSPDNIATINTVKTLIASFLEA